MTSASETATARRFHDATKYVVLPAPPDDPRVMMGTPPDLKPALGEQDLAIEPWPFKRYVSPQAIELPRNNSRGGMPALETLAPVVEAALDVAEPDLDALAQLCLRSIGILKSWTGPTGKQHFFRAAGCTGARYHLELYVITGDCPGLAAGIYHYAAHDHTFNRLRDGDFRGNVVAATGAEPATANAPAIIVCTSTFWRNSWRYQERTYRHVFWDTGTLFTNILALAADAGLPASVVMGFADDQVNALIGVDGQREAAVALLALGRSSTSAPGCAPIQPLHLPTQPASVREIDFPLIGEMHLASSLARGDDAANWRGRWIDRVSPAPSGTMYSLNPLPIEQRPGDSIDAVIQRRRSNRHYATATPLSFEHFSTVLASSCKSPSIDALDPAMVPLYDVYVIANNVAGLPTGSYVFHPELGAVELLQPGDQREDARRLACDQQYAADAHVNVYALANLDPILERYGDRGYRLVQLEAALFGGRIQLAAHALGLGAVGSTSADDDVTAHFAPHAAGKSFLFVAVFGISRKATAEERAASTGFIKNADG